MPQPQVQDFQDIDSEELAKQLYDVLMAEIEPDLMLANIPLLDQKYGGESEDEKKARMLRYEDAYKKFDKAFADFMAEVNQEVRTTKREALKEKEAAARQSDQQAMASIESAFS